MSSTRSKVSPRSAVSESWGWAATRPPGHGGRSCAERCAVSHHQLDYSLDEFAFRFNRRHSRHPGRLFYRLLQGTMATEPHPTAASPEKPPHNQRQSQPGVAKWIASLDDSYDLLRSAEVYLRRRTKHY
jgi:hypothetical protein